MAAMKEKILVTGGNGFLGDAIVQMLLEKHPEFDVVVFDIASSPTTGCLRENVEYIQANIIQKEEVLEVLARTKPRAIIHTAGKVPNGQARYNRSNWDEVHRINVDGTRNMLGAAKLTGARAFVYTSSCTVVSDDLNNDYPNMDESILTGFATLPYGHSKAIAEKLVLAANSQSLKTCALRPSTLFGPGDPHCIPVIHACIAKHETPYIIGTGANMYDFTYITNGALAHTLALENLLSENPTAAGEAFFINNGEPLAFRDFCVAVWKEFGHIPPFELTIPRRIAKFAGLCAEVAGWIMGTGEATLSRGSVLDACGTRYSNGTKARDILGYAPEVKIPEGLRIAAEDYKRRLAMRVDEKSDVKK